MSSVKKISLSFGTMGKREHGGTGSDLVVSSDSHWSSGVGARLWE
jgi:hypothetical protein